MTTIHYALAHQDRESSIGLSFPDVPGCFAAAEDEAGVVDAAREALDLFFEDADPADHPSRGLAALRADPEIASALATGAVLIAIPWIPSGRTVRANISIDSNLLAEIDRAAKRRGLSRSGFLASVAREKLSA